MTPGVGLSFSKLKLALLKQPISWWNNAILLQRVHRARYSESMRRSGRGGGLSGPPLQNYISFLRYKIDKNMPQTPSTGQTQITVGPPSWKIFLDPRMESYNFLSSCTPYIFWAIFQHFPFCSSKSIFFLNPLFEL